MIANNTAKLLASLTAIAALAFAVVPIFTEPFTGFEPSQMPVPVSVLPVQPEGYAFAIWGVIYIWLIVGSIYGVLQRAMDPEWSKMRAPLLISMAIGAAWIPVAHTSPVLATFLIFIMLAFAVWAIFRSPQEDFWTASGPVGLYAGWLTAASFVALSTVLVGHGVLSEGPASWMALACAFAVAIGLGKLDMPVSYTVASVWALIGITVANWGVWPAFAVVAALAAVVLATLEAGKQIERRSRLPRS